MDDTEVAVKLEAHEHEIGSLKYRVKDLEKQNGVIQELAISINKMAVGIENMQKELSRQGNRLDVLEDVPRETGKLIKTAIITALVGGMVGTVLTAIFTML